MSSSPDSFHNSFDSHEPRQELDSPFLNEEYLVEEARTPQTWRTPVPGFQLESPFLEAFEEGWGAIGEAEEFEENNFADFSADYESELETEEFLGNLEEEEVPPAWLKLFVHFLPGLTEPIPLEPSKLNPGYIDSNDELILSNLQSKLKNLLETKYKSGNKIRVALVDLTSPTKLKNPDYAGFRSTVETYGASCSKVAALYAAHQLRFDLMTQARANLGLTQRQIFEAWANLGISDRERERPNLKQIFNISNGLDDSIPKTIDFSPSFQKTLETVARFGDPNYNKSAAIVIDLLGFPYIASVLWQSGLYHPKRGGLWLGADYGGHTWKRDPIGGQSQGVNALSLATFYTLLAQDRLIDADASQSIKQILSQTKVSAANKGTFEKILRAKGMLKTSDKIYSKFGVWDKWFHDGALIERTLGGGETLRYVAVILTESYDKSRRYGVLRDLLVDLDKLIQTNNSVTDAQELGSTEYESNNLFFSGYGDKEVSEVDNWGELFANEEDELEADVFDEFVDELDEEEFEYEGTEEFEESSEYLFQETAETELGELQKFSPIFYQEELREQNETSQITEVMFPSGESLPIVKGAIARGEEHYDPTTDPNDPDFKKRKVHLPLLPLLDVSGSNRSKKLSKNFTAGEFAQSFEKARIDPKLVQCLQALRDYVDKPITITSGYRPYTYNIDIYEKRDQRPTKSQHSSGRAVDIKIDGFSGLQIAKAAIDVCGCDIGVGIAYTYAHIDVRGEFSYWTYITNKKDKDKAIREITDYHNQQCKGKPRSGKQSATSPQDTAKPTAELVRFAQRVLNATEGERLDVNGDFGKLTRGALERFRRKYSLGVGDVLDDKTQLALAQRALEEIAQQSLFPKLGVLDAKTEQALIAFKSDRGLGFNAVLDATTRAALADALARRVGAPSAPASSQRQGLPATGTGSRSLSEKITSGGWGGWKGRQTTATAFITPRNDIKDKYDLAVAVAARVETGEAFDKVQMYDKGILSWGIKQWTLHRGSLQKLLGFIKTKLAKSLWTELFPGIDIQADKILINGTAYPTPRKDDDQADLALRKVFRGKERPEDFDKDRMDYWLAIFARAGRHPVIQKLQFEYALQSLKNNLNMHLGKVLKAREEIKESEIHNYRKVGDYVEISPLTLALFNGMETQNPKWTYLYLKRIIDRLANKYGTHDISKWPFDWQGKFAQELKKEFEESGVACWGRKALQTKSSCKKKDGTFRTSRTEKILQAFQQLSHGLGIER